MTDGDDSDDDADDDAITGAERQDESSDDVVADGKADVTAATDIKADDSDGDLDSETDGESAVVVPGLSSVVDSDVWRARHTGSDGDLPSCAREVECLLEENILSDDGDLPRIGAGDLEFWLEEEVMPDGCCPPASDVVCWLVEGIV
jgi:hypothetical protein